MHTIDNNKLIAEFMGDHHKNAIFGSELPQYHFDWNELMPVVEKIEGMIFNNDEYYNFNILGGCYVIVISSHGNELIISDTGQSKLECVYIAAVQFIQWYNNRQH